MVREISAELSSSSSSKPEILKKEKTEKTNPQSKLQTKRCHYSPSACCQAKPATVNDGSTQPNEDLESKESAEKKMEVDIEVKVSNDISRSKNEEDWAAHHLTYW
nr:hypothetical protein CFP56_38717 [Quercus suber]